MVLSSYFSQDPFICGTKHQSFGWHQCLLKLSQEAPLRPALLPLQLPRYAVLRSHLPSCLPLIWRAFAHESQATSPESLLQLSRIVIPSDTITILVEILTH